MPADLCISAGTEDVDHTHGLMAHADMIHVQTTAWYVYIYIYVCVSVYIYIFIIIII